MPDSLEAAIKTGLETTRKSRRKKLDRTKFNMNAKAFRLVFERRFSEEGFGRPDILTKKDRGMLKQWVHALDKAGWTDRQLYELADWIVSEWRSKLLGKAWTTVNLKSIVFPRRPSLRAVLYCKNAVVSEFLGEESSFSEEKEATIDWLVNRMGETWK